LTDNSHKVKRDSLTQTHSRMATQNVHQMNLQSSVIAPEFYEDSYSTKEWEVVELRISGLSGGTTRRDVKSLCEGFNLQVVKIQLDWNPVVNVSKGRATVHIRYNPPRESTSFNALIQRIHEENLKVEY